MTRYPYHNVIGAKISGYIQRDKLETFLEARFPSHQHPGAEYNRFEIKVYSTTLDIDFMFTGIQETHDQWEFYAPELIPEVSWRKRTLRTNKCKTTCSYLVHSQPTRAYNVLYFDFIPY